MKTAIKDMLIAADAACDLMKALANPHRLAIMCQLNEKERSVSELADLLNIRVSTVSQHLALLRRDGLVTARRNGQTIWYSVGSAPARELIRTLYRIYCEPAAGCPPTEPQKRVRPARRRPLARNQGSRREVA
jgi:DNA-binding transcriptional ArsR family regulator